MKRDEVTMNILPMCTLQNICPQNFKNKKKLLLPEFKEAKHNKHSAYWRAIDGNYCLFVDGAEIKLPKENAEKR